MEQILLRTNIGYGLTDEAYGLSFAIDRGKNGQRGETALFADITSIPLTLTSFNIQYFRLFGLFTLASLMIYLVYFHIIRNSSPTWRSSFSICLFAFSILLTIPTSFRYLLITPTYQWVVMLLAILAVSLTLMIVQLQSNRILPLLFLSLSIFLVTLSRPTSGMMLLLLVNTYISYKCSLRKLRQLIQLNLLILIFFICYVTVYWKAVTAFVERYIYLKDLDPSGSNLWNETVDILASFLFVWSIFTLGYELSKHVYLENRRLVFRFPKLNFLSIFFLAICVFSVTRVTLANPGPLHLLLIVFIFLMGFFSYSFTNQNLNLSKMVLTSAPILTQFGSNSSAAYLIPPILISVMMYTLFDLNVDAQTSRQINTFESSTFQNLIRIALSFTILSITVLQIGSSYETHLPSKELRKDSISSLYYSLSKLESIQNFRKGASLSGEFSGEKILDLSFWHPGAILYLGGLQFPLAVDNKVFRRTLSIQVDATINQIVNLGPERVPSIIIETSRTKSIKRCLDLLEYIEDTELKYLLSKYGFNPKMKDMSIYVSDPVDLTLYPKNISYLVPCRAD